MTEYTQRGSEMNEPAPDMPPVGELMKEDPEEQLLPGALGSKSRNPDTWMEDGGQQIPLGEGTFILFGRAQEFTLRWDEGRQQLTIQSLELPLAIHPIDRGKAVITTSLEEAQ
jgi:hypothetical protein